jgi:[acyl-carrier-protein] S-malonyltransferase
MGADLLREPRFDALADQCSLILDLDLRRLLTDAPEEELTLTQHAQPALLFCGVALTTLLRERGIEPAAVAGHSAGEYAALVAAGALSVPDAMRAIGERGRAMAEAAPYGTSSMAAVLGIPTQDVLAAIDGLDGVWPANYNTPTQTVIAGTVVGVEAATPKLLEAGARRVLPLKVAAAFHTPLMQPAAARLRQVLDSVEWETPGIPVVANVTADVYPDGASAPDLLERQLASPVRWGDCVLRLRDLGCDGFLEVGPRRALSGMLRELVPGLPAGQVATPEAVAVYEA